MNKPVGAGFGRFYGSQLAGFVRVLTPSETLLRGFAEFHGANATFLTPMLAVAVVFGFTLSKTSKKQPAPKGLARLPDHALHFATFFEVNQGLELASVTRPDARKIAGLVPVGSATARLTVTQVRWFRSKLGTSWSEATWAFGQTIFMSVPALVYADLSFQSPVDADLAAVIARPSAMSDLSKVQEFDFSTYSTA